MKRSDTSKYRKTAQPLLPKTHKQTPPGEYDMYPSLPVEQREDRTRILHLASHLLGHSQVVIDDYVGVLWDYFQEQLDQALQSHGVHAEWISVANAIRSAEEINRLIEPSLGAADPIFGKRFIGTLSDFESVQKGGLKLSYAKMSKLPSNDSSKQSR